MGLNETRELFSRSSGGARFVVTGASGFIGGRLCELLVEAGASVRGVVGHLSHAARLARYDMEIVQADLGSAEGFESAIEGATVVVHCAYSSDNARNMSAASQLIRAADSGTLSHVVHLSSVSVYEPLPDGRFDESAPRRRTGWAYADAKLDIELRLEDALQRGTPVSVLQPTVVYGPYGEAWTNRIARMLLEGTVQLPSSSGRSNAVYVDDVCAAILLATTRPHEAIGRFLISGRDCPTWLEFFEAYRGAVNAGSIEVRPLSSNPMAPQQIARRALRDPRALLEFEKVQHAAQTVKRLVGPSRFQKVKAQMPDRIFAPDAQAAALYRSTGVASSDAARDAFGYEASFAFSEGMRLTADYLRWARLTAPT